MKISYFCPRWGSEEQTWDDFLGRVKREGYDGVEIGLPENDHDSAILLEKIHALDLKFILQHWETNEKDFRKHTENFQRVLERLAVTKPYQINSHTGKDYFSVEQNTVLLNTAHEIALRNGVTITHETHRGRCLFAAHTIGNYLKKFPELKVTLDVSHWFCVAESLLKDQEEAIENSIPHIHHIHARIGHTQGPQVNDPRLPKWEDTLNRHYEIWDQIVAHHRRIGTGELPFTTEFGPEPYMPIVPKGCPNDFQFEMNVFMLQKLKARYN